MHTHSMTRISILVAIAASFIVPAPAQQLASIRAIRPSDLTWRSIPGYPPGYERAVLEDPTEGGGPHTYRVRLPADFRTRPHTHPRDEHVTVLKGTWYLGLGKSFDEKSMQAFETGSFVIIPADVPHYIMTRSDETVVQVNGIGSPAMTNVNEAPQPASGVRAIRPNDLTWRSISGYPAGYERAVLEGTTESRGPYTIRGRLPAHFRLKPHTHPSDEHVTVLKGPWYLGVGNSFDEKSMQRFETGSFVIIPAGLPHYVMCGRNGAVVQTHGIGLLGTTFVTEDRGR